MQYYVSNHMMYSTWLFLMRLIRFWLPVIVWLTKDHLYAKMMQLAEWTLVSCDNVFCIHIYIFFFYNACYLTYYFKIECSALLFHSEFLSDIMIWFTWQILHDITTVLTNPRAPLGLLRQRVQSNLQLGGEAEFELIVSTLDVWSQQLTSLAVSQICFTFGQWV